VVAGPPQAGLNSNRGEGTPAPYHLSIIDGLYSADSFCLRSGVGRIISCLQMTSESEKKGDVTWHKTFYPDGRVEWETPYVNGSPEGIEHHFWENGSLAQETIFRKGRKQGIEKRYRRGGTLDMELPYDNGRLSGHWKIHDAGGRLRNDTPFVNGLQHGTQKIYAANGELLVSGEWILGTGVHREYDDRGILRRSVLYRDGCKHGPMLEYDEQGRATREWCYVDGLRRDREEWERAEQRGKRQ